MTNEDIISILAQLAPLLIVFVLIFTGVLGVIIYIVQGEWEYSRFKKRK